LVISKVGFLPALEKRRLLWKTLFVSVFFLFFPVAEYSGHQAGSFYVKTSISSDGEYLVSGSTDKNIYVWRTKGAEFEREPRLPITTLSGHTAEVTGVDISFSSMSKVNKKQNLFWT